MEVTPSQFQVLYAELKLPTVDGILDSDGEHFPHSKRFTRRAIKGSTSNMLKCLRRSARSGPSTKKDVLHKLEDVHSLPKIVIEWRQINNALTKVDSKSIFLLI